MSLVEDALNYEKLGWFVLPIHPVEKRPLTKWAYRKDRPPTPDEIRSWFKNNPDARVGIATGAASGVDVVDLDGPQARERFEALYGIPGTIMQSTGRAEGGSHLFFKCNGNGLRNVTGKLTEKEQRFAIQVAKGATKTNAALAAFDTESPNSARALGNKLVKKPSVNAAIADLMDYHGMDRSYRVAKLKQHVDNVDPGISLKALDQSWKLDGAYQEERPPQVINIEELRIEAGALREERMMLEKELARLDGEITDAEFEELGANDDTEG